MLAFIPILVLAVAVFLLDLRRALFLSLIVTIAIFLGFYGNPSAILQAFIDSISSTIKITLIIFGALFLLYVIKENGILEEIENSLSHLKMGKGEKFFFLSMSLTFFFEGIAGFGTPGAVVAPLLTGLGYSRVISISSVLLMDAVAVIFGAVGTPITAGFPNISADMRIVSFISAIFNSLAGVVFILFMISWYEKRHGKLDRRFVFEMFAIFSISFILLSYVSYHISAILSSIILIAYVSIRKSGKIKIYPWKPYIISSAFLMFPRLTGFNPSILSIPLFSPFPVLFATALALYPSQSAKALLPAAKKSALAFEVLLMSIFISSLMVSGGMVSELAESAANLSFLYPVASPFIGIIGAFLSGSNTVSNIMFSGLQYDTAILLGLRREIILALQNSGGGIGNAICLFNIIAASAVVGWKKHEIIIRKNAVPVLVAGILIGLLGLSLNLILSV